MACQIIQDAEPNFPANLFTLEEDTVEASVTPIGLPSAAVVTALMLLAIDFDWETEIDE